MSGYYIMKFCSNPFSQHIMQIYLITCTKYINIYTEENKKIKLGQK